MPNKTGAEQRKFYIRKIKTLYINVLAIGQPYRPSDVLNEMHQVLTVIQINLLP